MADLKGQLGTMFARQTVWKTRPAPLPSMTGPAEIDLNLDDWFAEIDTTPSLVELATATAAARALSKSHAARSPDEVTNDCSARRSAEVSTHAVAVPAAPAAVADAPAPAAAASVRIA